MATRWRKSIAVGSLFVIGILLDSGSVRALGLGGIAGSPLLPSAQSCFINAGQNGAIQNECSTAAAWQVPLSLNQGYHVVTINGTNVNGLFCSFTAENQNGTFSNGTSVTWTGSASTLTLSATIPSYGAAYVLCSLGPYTSLNTINYAQ